MARIQRVHDPEKLLQVEVELLSDLQLQVLDGVFLLDDAAASFSGHALSDSHVQAQSCSAVQQVEVFELDFYWVVSDALRLLNLN